MSDPATGSTNSAAWKAVLEQFGSQFGSTPPALQTGETVGDAYLFANDDGSYYVITASQADQPDPAPPGQSTYNVEYVDPDGQKTNFTTDVNSDVSLGQVLSLYQAQNDFSPVADTYASIQNSNPTAANEMLSAYEQQYASVQPPLSQEAITIMAETQVVQTVENFLGENGQTIGSTIDPNMVALAANESLTEMAAAGQGGVTTAQANAPLATLTSTAAQTYASGSPSTASQFNSLISGNPVISALVVAYENQNINAGQDPVTALVNARTSALNDVDNYYSENGLDLPKAGVADTNVNAAVQASLNTMVSAGTITAGDAGTLIATATTGASVAAAFNGVVDVNTTGNTTGVTSSLASSINSALNSAQSTKSMITTAMAAIQNNPNITPSDKNILLNYLKDILNQIDAAEQELANLEQVLAKNANQDTQTLTQNSQTQFNDTLEKIHKEFNPPKQPCWKKVLMPLISVFVALACIIAAPFTGGASLTAMIVVIAVTIALTAVTTALSQTGILQKGFADLTKAMSNALGNNMPTWAKDLIMFAVIAVIVVVAVVATRGAALGAVGTVAGTIGAETAANVVTNVTVTMGMQFVMDSGVINDFVGAILSGAGASSTVQGIVTAVVSTLVAILAMAAASGGGGKDAATSIGDTADSLAEDSTSVDDIIPKGETPPTSSTTSGADVTSGDPTSANVNLKLDDKVLADLQTELTKAIEDSTEELGAESTVTKGLQTQLDAVTYLKLGVSGLFAAGASAMTAASDIAQGLYDEKLAKMDNQMGALQNAIDVLQGLITMLKKLLASILGGSSVGSSSGGGLLANIGQDITAFQSTFANILQGLSQALKNLSTATPGQA
jgi:hypothetical protein